MDIAQYELCADGHVGVQTINTTQVESEDTKASRVLQEQFERPFALCSWYSIERCIILGVNHTHDLAAFGSFTALLGLHGLYLRPSRMANVVNIEHLADNGASQDTRLRLSLHTVNGEDELGRLRECRCDVSRQQPEEGCLFDSGQGSARSGCRDEGLEPGWGGIQMSCLEVLRQLDRQADWGVGCHPTGGMIADDFASTGSCMESWRGGEAEGEVKRKVGKDMISLDRVKSTASIGARTVIN